MYYYQIDKGIKGGELELSSVIEVEDTGRLEGQTTICDYTIPVQEGMSLVFSNVFAYHRVRELYGNGSRKIIAFFLLRNDALHPLDARRVVVNWKHHARVFVQQALREFVPNDSVVNHKWLVDLVQDYVVGDESFVKKAIDKYRDCRNAQGHKVSAPSTGIVSRGRPMRPLHTGGRCGGNID